jgi:hypothetical protein
VQEQRMFGPPPWLIHALIWGIAWLAVLAALAVFFLVRTCMRRTASRKYSGEGPFCTACGYSLKVRTSDHCPECGAKLTLPRAIHPTAKLAPLPWQVRIIVIALITGYPLVLPFYIIDANDKMQVWWYWPAAIIVISAIWMMLALLLRRHLNRAARRFSLPAKPSAVH